MPIILRIDVDNPYGWNTFPKKVLNYFSINFRRLPIRYSILGYLNYANKLFERLEMAQVPASWFFLVQTRPSKQLQQSLLKAKHEIAYHAERTSSLKNFKSDLRILSKNLTTSILGFSKHGSGKRKLSKYHTAKYNLDSLTQFGQEVDFKYFSGNDETPSSNLIKMNNLQVFPGAFWLNENYRDISKYSIDWLLEKASTGKTFVVLTHPHAWATSQKEKNDLEKLISSIDDFQTFSSIIY
ncbi:MAG: hypothetical protein ACFFC6_04960 [Promethearchaeota archaeon]